MKLPISAGVWLLSTTTIYLVVGLVNLFLYRFSPTEYIEIIWLFITAIPLYIPMSKLVAVDPIWKM